MRTYRTRKRILVTGGAGFLGSHHLFGWPRPAASRLCERLITEGNDVLCADNFFTGTKDNIAHLLPGLADSLMAQSSTVCVARNLDRKTAVCP